MRHTKIWLLTEMLGVQVLALGAKFKGCKWPRTFGDRSLLLLGVRSRGDKRRILTFVPDKHRVSCFVKSCL